MALHQMPRQNAMERSRGGMTRSANLYVSPQLYRWLGWLAELRTTEQGDAWTADRLAEEVLRGAILAQFPTIEKVEADYWNGRQKLDAEAAAGISISAKGQR